MPRTHVVLVPGFGGFDAFGDLRYYDRVTELFGQWRRPEPPKGWAAADADTQAIPWEAADAGRRAATALHYFDNHPTAGVGIRARLLAEFLAKQRVRGQILPDDRVVLVGHSTGGLDIRALLRDLEPASDAAPIHVDGLDVAVPKKALRRLIRRVVFLSVPHHGTNIADFLCENGALTATIAGALRAGVETGRFDWPWPAEVVRRLAGGSGLADAAADLLDVLELRHLDDPEDPRFGERLQAARSEEVFSEVRGWLAHAGKDRLSLETLRVQKGPLAEDLPDALPAGVEALSFATRGRRPFPGQARFRRMPRALPELLRALPEDPSGAPSDVFYRAGWLLCSAGPFALGGQAIHLRDGSPAPVEPWENDGVVNTASMLWPDPAATRLVKADHGDLNGHFLTVARADPSGPGKHDAYDLLVSGSGFGLPQFTRVWREVFDFAALADG